MRLSLLAFALCSVLCFALGAASLYPDPWAGSEGLDVVKISEGESVDLSQHLVPGKFTIVEVGASWCSPCHVAAKNLQNYLATHGDVAVRTVDLAGSPTQSRAQPAAQLLPTSGRIPYFEVYDPDGRRLYRGNRLDRALRIIARRR